MTERLKEQSQETLKPEQQSRRDLLKLGAVIAIAPTAVLNTLGNTVEASESNEFDADALYKRVSDKLDSVIKETTDPDLRQQFIEFKELFQTAFSQVHRHVSNKEQIGGLQLVISTITEYMRKFEKGGAYLPFPNEYYNKKYPVERLKAEQETEILAKSVILEASYAASETDYTTPKIKVRIGKITRFIKGIITILKKQQTWGE